MNIDIDLAKLMGWLVAGLAGILMFFFKRELSAIDKNLEEINNRLLHTEKEMTINIQKVEAEVAVNKQNIALNSVRDEEFKKFLDEKLGTILREIQELKNNK